MRRVQLPEGVPGGTEVYRLDYRLDAPPGAADWQVLSASEQARALRFRRAEDRCRAVRTRACLRRLLAQRLDCSPAELLFELNANGKPSAPASGIEFNVSHSGGLGLIALSERPVGVDIERQEADPVRLQGLEELVYTPAERRAPLEGGVLAHWVAKEAALKALGVGLSEPLKALSVSLPCAPAAPQYQLTHERSDWRPLALWPLDVERGYRAALALA
ncbi:hypothetical protein ASC94_12575 [Massilia sp. Root418]|jgi:4'-phosphopantetheinyl transferase|uniref:4'-phosphopantetheinyl transferase family protein n=1 Tax=Massilia sp. Root418 TaxID=1736532 RepID=UPI0006F55AE3|nr:4'-phosphopantetheinyl transferase superfamily protein [Massilia sp. Root418]KQW93465.1 hypothetical protein ASC94_12575 [Massilia sp. Root418]